MYWCVVVLNNIDVDDLLILLDVMKAKHGAHFWYIKSNKNVKNVKIFAWSSF